MADLINQPDDLSSGSSPEPEKKDKDDFTEKRKEGIWQSIQDYLSKRGFSDSEIVTTDDKELTSDGDEIDPFLQGGVGRVGSIGDWREADQSGENEDTGFKARENRYRDFRQMIEMPELESGLQVYSDEPTQPDKDGHVVQIVSDNSKIKDMLERLFYQKINIDREIWGITFGMCWLGDDFREIVLDKETQKEILKLQKLRPEKVERVEKDNKLEKFTVNGKDIQPFRIVHFKNKTERFEKYGASIFESGRSVWKQLKLLEESLIIYRVCLRGNTRILTDKGYKHIKDIKADDNVYSFTKDQKLKKAKITKQVNNGPHKIWCAKSTHREIEGNATHPILVRNNETGIVDYVEIQNLIPKTHQFIMPQIENGEKIPLKLKESKYEMFSYLNDSGLFYFKNTKYDKSILSLERCAKNDYGINAGRVHQFLYASRKHIKALPYDQAKTICLIFNIPEAFLVTRPKGMYNSSRLNLPDYVDEEFARFFGFMLGDGFIRKNLHEVGFSTGIYEEINNKYKNTFVKYCSSAKFTQEYRSSNADLGKVCANSYYLCNLMIDMGFVPGCYDKQIPEWIYRCSNSIKEAFIDGLIDADGHRRKIRKTDSMEIEVANSHIIEGLKELCNQLGWKSGNIGSRQRKDAIVAGKNNPNKLPSKFKRTFSLYITKKPQSLYENILKVEQLNIEEDVYDITVDSEEHNFIANGIPVHNTRAPERKIFYVDVGRLPADKWDQFVERYKSKFQKKKQLNVTTGRVDSVTNVLSYNENYYIPRPQDRQGSSIETLPGIQGLGEIDDIAYFKDKLMALLRIPRDYVSYASQSLQSQTSGKYLSEQDIRFARIVTKVQDNLLDGLKKIAIVYLALNGVTPEEVEQFELEMTKSSAIEELRRIEVQMQQFNLIASIKQLDMFPDIWILTNVLKIDDEEVQAIVHLMKVQKAQTSPETLAALGVGGMYPGEAPPGAEALPPGGAPAEGGDMGGMGGGMPPPPGGDMGAGPPGEGGAPPPPPPPPGGAGEVAAMLNKMEADTAMKADGHDEAKNKAKNKALNFKRSETKTRIKNRMKQVFENRDNIPEAELLDELKKINLELSEITDIDDNDRMKMAAESLATYMHGRHTNGKTKLKEVEPIKTVEPVVVEEMPTFRERVAKDIKELVESASKFKKTDINSIMDSLETYFQAKSTRKRHGYHNTYLRRLLIEGELKGKPLKIINEWRRKKKAEDKRLLLEKKN